MIILLNFKKLIRINIFINGLEFKFIGGFLSKTIHIYLQAHALFFRILYFYFDIKEGKELIFYSNFFILNFYEFFI